MTNLFYFKNLNSIGGTETFLYYMAKKYKDIDITIMYSNADIQQVLRLSKYVKVIKYYGQKIKCENAYFSYNIDPIDNIEAKEYVVIIHGDYLDYGITPVQHPKITRYIGVSDIAVNSFKKLLPNKEIKKIYNPVEIDEPQDTLILISATRLTKEKGKDRMIELMDLLDRNGRPWLWLIFTNDRNEINHPNVAYIKPKLNVIDYIKTLGGSKYAYLVQLSNAEGYGYSPVEALSVNVPVIVTDIPAMHEIGVKDGENGWIIPKSMKDIDVNKFYSKLEFSYKPPKDEWKNELINIKSNYKEEEIMKYKVKCIRTYTDASLCQEIKTGTEFIIDKERAEEIIRQSSKSPKGAVIAIIENVVEEPVIEKAVKEEEVEKAKPARKRNAKK